MPIKKTNNAKVQGGKFFGSLVVIFIIFAVVFGIYSFVSGKKQNNKNVSQAPQSKSEWQAVFLTNGQVYFGKITSESDSQLVMKDIYYLQVVQSLQQSTKEGEKPKPQNSLSLVKLGNELHGPTSQMRINKTHVLFIEDLRNDSQVVTAIKRYKQNPPKQQNVQNQQQPSQPPVQPKN